MQTAAARKPEESRSRAAAEPKEAAPAPSETVAGAPAGTPRFLRRAAAPPPAEVQARVLAGPAGEAAAKEGAPGQGPGEKGAEDEMEKRREPARGGLQQAGASAPEPPPLAEGAVRDVEILMPEPPAGLSGAETARLERVERRAGKAAAVTTVLPAAEESTQAARDAVTEPKDETEGRAQSSLVTALGTRPAPSPEIEKLCDDIRAIIRSKRPPDEDSLVKSDPESMAKAAGGQLNASIEGDVKRVDGTYDALDKPPEGTAQLKPKGLEAPPAFVETPLIDAASATPSGVPAENVSLDADVAASRARMDEAGMSSEPALLVQDGPIAAARAAQGELSETAQRDPAEVMAEQQAALGRASADMEALQQRALEALAGSRVTTVEGTTGQQKAMVGSEEQQRTAISLRAKTIFTSAQTQVNNLLGPLPKTAMSRWDSGVAVLSSTFKSRLSEVESWIEDRHSGAVGAVVGLWDDVTGLPGWVTRAYDAAEKDFGDGVCELIRKISTEVNGVVAACEAIIADARTRIDKLYTTDLPDGLRKWAEEERLKMSGQLDALQKKVTDTRANFDRDLVQRAASSVQEVREQIHALREKAKGLLGRIADAIGEFLDDPVKFIINGLLKLVGIPPASFWALVNRIESVISDIADDPLGFASNLLSALGEGFQGFFDRIGQHLLEGMLDWLFSGLGAVGVALPADLSLKSIITFFLQLMGISWPRIREVLAKHIGEENVALIEKAYELIANLIELGPEGLFEMIKEQLNPQMLLDQVLQMAKDYLVEALIKQVSIRIIALFNPVGAIVQAIEAIYRVLSWIFKNAARIFRLVETVVGGVAELIAGNISGMAKAVEGALAGLISPVIDFLADYVGLGDLPEKIADRIRGMQEWVMGIIDKVIGWLATKARGLLKALGLGGAKEDGATAGAYDGQIGETEFWTAAGESHRMWIVSEGSTAIVMMASGGGDSVLKALDIYKTHAEELGAEDPVRIEVLGLVDTARGLLSTIIPEAVRLASEIADTDTPDPLQVKAADDAVEAHQGQLKDAVSLIQTKLGLDDGSDADLQKLKAALPDQRLFSRQKLEKILGVSSGTAKRRLRNWQDQGLVFVLSSARTDERTEYSTDPVKAGQLPSNPNNRSKYGFSNPAKTSPTGLTILSKGINALSPVPVERASAAYHVDKARYYSVKSPATYPDFGFEDAILGHGPEGASEYWNRIGHTQTKAQNRTWNYDPANYHGPEHRIESAESGGSSPPYNVPTEDAGSNPEWL
jgi:hypothetical protein